MLKYLGRDRVQWLAVAAVLAAVNGMASTIMVAVERQGLLRAALDTFGINPIFWFALFVPAIIAFDAQGQEEPVGRLDAGVIALVLAGALAPVVTAGSAGVLLAAAWLFVSNARGSRGRRVAIMLFALTTTLIWGHLVLMAIGGTLVALDGQFVAWLAGTSAQDNLVQFTDGGKPIMIAYGCSSMHNVTMAIQFWVATTLLLGIPFGWRSALVGLAAVVANVFVNGCRMAILAHNRAEFDYWHTGGGGTLFAWIAVATVAVVVMTGCNAFAPRRV